ncbi:hypothetical protein [Spirosoma pollinicola]|uniref:Uncharacterized protein n=1 Tax=Spirosoma pollinicola TaxID=2057025 RepID=A0A2K8ZAY6_9BACT|nr:hypothetical protein [Spirosoma pollinicola]AUD07046.1 hypothetical protein CWM47_37650 [Spirosoma pollinicola]
MDTRSTYPLPGFYQYTYPTFVATPQYICVHFLTPDSQQAFVSYPHNRTCKAAQLIAISWFESVTLCPLEGQPQLMSFLGMLFTEEATKNCIKLESNQWLPNDLAGYEFSQQRMA